VLTSNVFNQSSKYKQLGGMKKDRKKLGKRNRTAGHNFERECVKKFTELGFENVRTSRYASREKDDQKVDLVGTEPLNIQCKYTERINYHEELKSMPEDTNHNIVIHKRKNKGTVVAMLWEDFEELVAIMKHEGLF